MSKYKYVVFKQNQRRMGLSSTKVPYYVVVQMKLFKLFFFIPIWYASAPPTGKFATKGQALYKAKIYNERLHELDLLHSEKH